MTRQRPVFGVTATRDGGWWCIVLDVDEDTFDLEVDTVLPDLSPRAHEAIAIRRRLAELQSRLGEIEPDAVSELRERLTVRDVAELFGITASRVSQIDRRGA